MLENGNISMLQYEDALSKDIVLTQRDPIEITKADYFAETVRRQVVRQYGEEKLYRGGLSILTTLVPELQEHAHDALRKGLEEYDKRHGWRGPITNFKLPKNESNPLVPAWLTQLRTVTKPVEANHLKMAVVRGFAEDGVYIGVDNGTLSTIPLEHMKWARKWINENSRGPVVKKADDVLTKGDVVLVQYNEELDNYHLEQIPDLNGAVVALDPHSGRVLAMVGGYDYSSPFNRAVQAKRQPGSAFKPFVYLTALLDKQFTPASIIVDAEIEFDLGNEQIWSPKNYSGKYYGPSTLRQGVERSRNAMTVRLAQMIGLNNIIKVSELLGIYNAPPAHYSYVLGAVETNVLNLTNAYAMLVNGGKKITPTLIEVIQNSNGKIIYKRDKRECETCYIATSNPYSLHHVSETPPILPDNRKQIIDPNSAYQMVSILEGVVKRGTGMKARDLKRTLGGKTGTTNDSFDSWFIGFSPDMVVGVYTGFDKPKTLGKKETGASVALPIFINFMEKALADSQDIPFRVPKDIQLVRIDKNTGLLPSPATSRRDIITEAFKLGTAPTIQGQYGTSNSNNYVPRQTVGTGGIY
ncbi:MAG: penicillin-binding protein 1A, partial [Rickettsiales bacterium]|nr:penicillin-binding protein 1A [Rickettsiales bacterium]